MASNPHSNVRTRGGEAFHSHPDLRAGFDHLAKATPHPKGAILFRQGQAPRGVFLLKQGRARLCMRSDAGRNVTFRNVGPGYVLGVPSTILNKPYLFTAELLEDSQVAFIPCAEVLEFLRRRSDLCFDVVQLLGGELMEIPPVVHRPATRRRRVN
jgi:CRP-like cAMP-binding protein